MMQPGNTQYVQNTFAPIGGENITRMYEYQQGCAGCGPKYSVVVTDSRLIAREKQPDQCCGCIEGAYTDTTVFLSDIALMRESKQGGVGNPCLGCVLATLTGACLPFLCGCLCGRCCGERAKHLEVKGVFNREFFIFKAAELQGAVNDITAMLLPAKHKK